MLFFPVRLVIDNWFHKLTLSFYSCVCVHEGCSLQRNRFLSFFLYSLNLTICHFRLFHFGFWFLSPPPNPATSKWYFLCPWNWGGLWILKELNFQDGEDLIRVSSSMNIMGKCAVVNASWSKASMWRWQTKGDERDPNLAGREKHLVVILFLDYKAL